MYMCTCVMHVSMYMCTCVMHVAARVKLKEEFVKNRDLTDPEAISKVPHVCTS